MIYTSVRVSKFRGLRALAVEDLGRLNLFVGPNNVGKTSLLEALWLFRNPNNPVLTMTLAGARGFNPVLQSPDSLWHTLFFDMDVERQIDIIAGKAGADTDVLTIALLDESVGEVGAGNGQADSSIVTAAATAAGPPQTLRYQYFADAQAPLVATFSLGLGRANYRAAPEFAQQLDRSSLPSPFLTARHRSSPEDLAGRFTKVQDTQGVGSLVRSIQSLEPRLRDLSIGYSLADRQPSLRAHLDGLKSPIPLHLLGDGVGWLAEMLLAVTTMREGLVLVDEIENGLYYRNMEAAWRARRREPGMQCPALRHHTQRRMRAGGDPRVARGRTIRFPFAPARTGRGRAACGDVRLPHRRHRARTPVRVPLMAEPEPFRRPHLLLVEGTQDQRFWSAVLKARERSDVEVRQTGGKYGLTTDLATVKITSGFRQVR